MRIWILQRYQVYARYALLAGLLLAPVVFTRKTVDVFNLVKITALWVTAILAILLWVMLSLERGVWIPKLKLLWFALAFLVVQAVATVFSQNLSMSIMGIYHRYGGLIPFLLYGGIFVVIVGLYWENPRDLKEVPRAIALASFLMTAYVIVQKLKLDPIQWRDSNGLPPTFPVGTMGNSNFAGGFLAVASPMFLYVVLSARKSWRWVLAAAFALDLLALWFTQTRGAFIGVGLAIAALAFCSRDKLARWMRLTALAGVIGAGLVFVVVVVHPGMKQAPSVFSQAGALSPFRTGTFQDRSNYWIAGLRIFKHHPIIGTGPDTYAANYSAARTAADGAKLGLTITDKPHNIFVEYAADSGILGIGSYLAMLGAGLWFAYRRTRKLGDNARLLLLAFLGTLVAYMGQGFFSIDVPPIAVMGWVGLAGIAILADPGAVAAREALAAAKPAAKRPGRPAKKKAVQSRGRGAPVALRVVRTGPTRWLEHGIACVVAVGLIVVGLRPYLADRIAHNAQVLQQSISSQGGVTPAQAAAQYQRAFGFNPLEPAYLALTGNLYESTGNQATDPATRTSDLNLALVSYRRALARQPKNVFNLMNLARVYGALGAIDPSKYPVSDGWWKKTVADDPTDYQVHEQYAQMLMAWGDTGGANASEYNNAVTQLNDVVHARPTQLTAWVSLVKVYRALGKTSEADAALTTAKTLGPKDPTVTALEPPVTATATTTATAGG